MDDSGVVGRLLNTQVITSSGTYTPTPGTRKIKAILTGEVAVVVLSSPHHFLRRRLEVEVALPQPASVFLTLKISVIFLSLSEQVEQLIIRVGHQHLMECQPVAVVVDPA